MRHKNWQIMAAVIAVSGVTVACDTSHDEDQHAQSGHAHSAHSPDTTSAKSEHDDHHTTEHAEASEHLDTHDHDDDLSSEMRQSGAHLHGDAKLAVALEEKSLFIELDTPLYNLTGFEYAPTTANEKATVEQTEALLSSPKRLFVVNSEAGCEPQNPSADVHLEFGQEHTSSHDEHHHEDAHDDESEAESDHGDTHRDVVIEYRFNCESLKAITEISVELFKLFPKIQELDTIYLDQTSQRSITLKPTNHKITVSH